MLEDLDEEAKQKILANLPEAARWAVEDALRFPESSTGRLMAREFVTVPADWNVGQTIDFLRANPDLPDDFYDIYLVDEAYRPVGSVSVTHVLRTRRAEPLTEDAQGDLRVFPPELDQEELAHTFRQYGASSAPVADAETGRLVGVVTLDDIVHVIDEEAEDDLMRLVGLGSVSDINRSSLQTARNRFIWLSVNLEHRRAGVDGDLAFSGDDPRSGGAGRADAYRRVHGWQCRHPDPRRCRSRAGDEGPSGTQGGAIHHP